MSELLFGLIMALTFTLGASLVVKEGPDATRELLIGVLGCNIAWGIIDGLLFIFNSMYGRGWVNRAIYLYKKNGRDGVGKGIENHLENTFGASLTGETNEAIRREVTDHIMSARTISVRLNRDDIFGAIASFILVAITAAPAVIPFLIFNDYLIALRVSNFVMIGLIYWIGCQWAAHIGANRQWVGISMAIGCLLIVQLTILLGG